jgi:hypothetical protein
MSKQKVPSKAQLAAWREARVQNYADTRSVGALARMVVELEDSYMVTPEFEVDEDWPERVRKLKVK